MTMTAHLEGEDQARAVMGVQDEILRTIREATGLAVTARGDQVHVEGQGPEAQAIVNLIESLAAAAAKGQRFSAPDVAYLARRAQQGNLPDLDRLFDSTVLVTQSGRSIRARTFGQLRYVEAIRRHGITFCIGPAGTGKTYLAMAVAIAALNANEYQRLILSRPAVEAGESLGFLPGDLREKVDPYLRPLYDALYDMLRLERAQRLMERGVIEVVPLAYMRGRTLNDAMILLDEAQNTTESQMKMFLTRMGYSSKVIVTGDVTQVDLPAGKGSGLVQAETLLSGLEGIAFVHLTEEDVVRHPLVRRIIQAYGESAQGVSNGSPGAAEQAAPSEEPKHAAGG